MAERDIDIVIRAKAVTAAAFAQVEKELDALNGKTKAVGKDADAAGKGLSSFGVSLSSAFTTAGVVLGAAAGGVIALGAGIVALGARGADVADIKDSFDVLNNTIGQDGSKSLAALRSAFQGTVTDYDIMKAANVSLTLGAKLSAEQFGLVGKSARVLADQIGGSSTDAFAAITKGIAQGNIKLLQSAGLMGNSSKAAKDYELAVAAAGSGLTKADKALMLKNFTLKEMERMLAITGEAAFDFNDAIDASKSFVNNFKDSLGQAIAQSPVVNAMLASFGKGLQASFGADQSGLIKVLIGYVNKFALFLVDAGDIALSVAGAIGRVWSGLETVFHTISLAVSAVMDVFANGIASTLELASKIPVLGDSYKGAATEARNFANISEAVTKGIRSQLNESIEGVKGNNTYGKTIESMRGGLSTMRGEMEKALTSTVDLTAGTKKGAKETQDAGNVLQFLTKEQKAAKKEMDQLLKSSADFEKGIKNLAFNGLDPALMSVKDIAKHFEELQRGLPGIAGAVTSLSGKWKDMSVQIKSTADVTKEHAQKQKEANDTVKSSLSSLSEAFATMAQTSGGSLGETAKWLGTVMTASNLAAKGADTLKTGWNQMNAEGGNVVAGAVNIAAGMMAMIAAMDQATQSTDKVKNALGGAMTGAQIGTAILPGWGTAIGAVAGGLVGMFRASSNAAKQAAKEMAAQQEKLAADTRAANEKLLAELTAQLSAAKTQFDGLIGKAKDMGFVFDASGTFVSVAFEKMKSTAEKYGISLEALGPSFQKARLHDAATAIIDDFTLLNKGGADVGGTLFGMRGKISDLVNDSIKFGTSIPANMKPWIEELARAGHLTDVDGKKLQDIGGLKFSDPIKTQFEQISDALLVAVRHLADIVASIAAIPSNKTTTITTRQQTIIDPTIDNSGGGSEGGDGGGEEPQMRHGGIVHAPLSGMGITVHGREAVVPLNQPSIIGSRLASEILQIGGAGAAGAADTARLDGLEEAIALLTRTVLLMPGQMSRSARDAQLALGTRR